MSNFRAIIRKGEIFVKSWNPELHQDQEKRKAEQLLADVLQWPVTIEETTFGQFFALIAKQSELYELIFRAALYGHPLKHFIDECNRPAQKTSDADFVRVYWHAELYQGEFEIAPCFDGWGDWPTENGASPIKGGIAMEFTPLYQYKDLPLKLDSESNIFSLDSREALLKGTREFTVYDVIHAILFEITWAGDAKGRAEASGSEAA